MKIIVLLATYNGDKYLRELLDSVLSQSIKVDILARDDHSADDTLTILEEYEGKYDCFHLLRGVSGGGSSKANFSLLLASDEVQQYDYVMFADQDDIWLPSKVEDTLEEMKLLEQQHGKNIPLLVHTDLEVVTANGRTVAPSLWKYNGFSPQKNNLSRLLIDNTVTGCTAMVNKTLFEKALPIPEEAAMHDSWLALVARCFGEIGILYRSTIQYRQHDQNVVGALGKENFFTKAYIAIHLTFSGGERSHRTQHRVREARAFLNRYSSDFNTRDKQVLEVFTHIFSYGPLKRLQLLFRYGFYKQRVVKTLGMMLIWFLHKRS